MSKKWYNDGSTVLGVVIVALSVVSVVLFYSSVTAARRVAACQHSQNIAFGEAIKARAAATHDGNAAIRKLFVTAGDPSASEAVKHQALNDYLVALDRLDAAQVANPLIVGTCSS